MRAVSGSHGFHGRRCVRLIPPIANSVVTVLPRRTQPACSSAVTNGPCGGTRSVTSTRLPAFVGMPRTLYKSFSAIGRPINGPITSSRTHRVDCGCTGECAVVIDVRVGG